LENVDVVMKLVEGNGDHDLLIRDIIMTALTLSPDKIRRNDIKTLHADFHEMTQAFQFFAPFSEARKVSIFGSARTDPAETVCAQAAEFAKKVAPNFMVITGAGGGIMRAVQGGAGREKSFGINILLPFEQMANEFIKNDPKLMTFKYFFLRKLLFMKEADALAFFPGGFGTHDEGFEALTLLQTGKCNPLPVVFIDLPGGHHWKDWFSYVEEKLLGNQFIAPEDLKLFKITDQVDEAVHEIVHFYNYYHSMQLIDGKIVMRLSRPLSRQQLESLNDLFSDIIVQGKMIETGPLAEEDEEFQDCDLPRILFHFDRKSFGRLREMINAINDFTKDQA
jgi:hypothetical protein